MGKGRRKGENSTNSSLNQDTVHALAPGQLNLRLREYPHFLKEERVDIANCLSSAHF